MWRRIARSIALPALLAAPLHPSSASAQETRTSARAIYAAVLDSVLAGYARAYPHGRPEHPPITLDPEFGRAPAVDVRVPPRLGSVQPIPAGYDTLLRVHPADSSLTDLSDVVELRSPLCWTHAPARNGNGETCPAGVAGTALPPHLTLSQIAFSADSLRAVVYATYWCGSLCGEGRYYLMGRTPGGTWRVAGTYRVYVS